MTNFNQPLYRHDEPVLDTSNVRRIAEEAVRVRLGPEYVADYGIRGCLRAAQPLGNGTAIVHLNSGGNASAVERALTGAGYAVVPGTPPGYGVTLVVTGRRTPQFPTIFLGRIR